MLKALETIALVHREIARTWRKIWNDESGVIVSAEIVMVLTIMVIGMLTGLTSLRDGVITELADVGAAIGSLDQSFQMGCVYAHSSATSGSYFIDTADFCDLRFGTVAYNQFGAYNPFGYVGNSRCLVINGGGMQGLGPIERFAGGPYVSTVGGLDTAH